MTFIENDHETKQKRFSDAYKPLHACLVRFVQNMVWSHEDKKDIVNETALIAYERFDTLRDKSSLLSFLFTIASRQVYKYRQQARMNSGTIKYNETIADPSIDLHRKVEAKELYNALDLLPYKTREALILFEINGLTLAEIQKIQGDSLSAVKSKLVRGRECLRKIFDEKIPTEPVLLTPEKKSIVKKAEPQIEIDDDLRSLEEISIENIDGKFILYFKNNYLVKMLLNDSLVNKNGWKNYNEVVEQALALKNMYKQFENSVEYNTPEFKSYLMKELKSRGIVNDSVTDIQMQKGMVSIDNSPLRGKLFEKIISDYKKDKLK